MADNRIYNFSAGPSMLPVPVLERCAADMLNYQGSGMSVMEMSHRSKVYDGIIKETEAALGIQLLNRDGAHGSTLTEEGDALLDAYISIDAQLQKDAEKAFKTILS